MKYLVFLALILSGHAFAECFVPIPPESSYILNCPFDPGTTGGYPNQCSGGGRTWIDFTGTLVPTIDPLETCSGYWISTAEQVTSGTGGSDTSAPVVQAIEQSTLAITTALACVCFFLGLNSWEASAK
ncbi:hypothetical protein [Rheinheimera sp.]|uniref:hypothetical protein n=1 Tax=Rheinheimera sp. TaxID=1869214 RepID=UPI00307CD8AD